jgi:hypothetical protein
MKDLRPQNQSFFKSYRVIALSFKTWDHNKSIQRSKQYVGKDDCNHFSLTN